MSPLEENGYRLGIVVLVFGISRQLLDLGAYDGRIIAFFGAAIAVLVLFLSTLNHLYEDG